MLVVPFPQPMHSTSGKGSGTGDSGLPATLYGLPTIVLPLTLRPEDRATGEAHARPVEERRWLRVKHAALPLVGFVTRPFVESVLPVIGRTPDVERYRLSLCARRHRKHRPRRSIFASPGSDASSKAMPSMTNRATSTPSPTTSAIAKPNVSRFIARRRADSLPDRKTAPLLNATSRFPGERS